MSDEAREAPADGVPKEGIEVPADGTLHALEGDGSGQALDPIVDYTRVLQNQAGEWYFLGYSSNGNVIVRSSEGYENEAWARKVAAELGPVRDED